MSKALVVWKGVSLGVGLGEDEGSKLSTSSSAGCRIGSELGPVVDAQLNSTAPAGFSSLRFEDSIFSSCALLLLFFC